MQLATNEEIEAPVARVFEALTDFDAIEQQIMRRGVSLRRLPQKTEGLLAQGWEARYRYRGRERTTEIRLSHWDPPNTLAYEARTGGLETRAVIELLALSPRRTRVGLDMVLLPRTLSARLLVQSIKLARPDLLSRFRERISGHARDLEARIVRSG